MAEGAGDGEAEGHRDGRARGAGKADGAGYDSALSLEELQRLHIERVLKEEGGRVERAAARLGIARSSLYQKIKQYGLGPFDVR
ncbi:MAG: hypothetical protein C4547_01330 [Phycisphaerales bacterium]|nr:MAG: hypothetical protein C4547_01330 [Phycisphaerales bacterium]